MGLPCKLGFRLFLEEDEGSEETFPPKEVEKEDREALTECRVLLSTGGGFESGTTLEEEEGGGCAGEPLLPDTSCTQ